MKRHGIICDSATKARVDALLNDPGAGTFFERELMYTLAEVLEAKLPPRNVFRDVPSSSEIPLGAQTYRARMYESMAVAKWIRNWASDLPFVEVAYSEVMFHIEEFGLAYSFSLNEIEAARFANLPLERQKAETCRIGIEQFLNRVGYYGAPEVGIFGMLDYPYFPHLLLGRIDSSQTPDAIAAMVGNFWDQIIVLSKTTANPDTLLLPVQQFGYMSRTRMGDGSNVSILRYLKDTLEGLTNIFRTRELDNGGTIGGTTPGVNGNPVMIAYEKSKRVLKHHVVRPFTQRPPQEVNLAFKVPCHARTGGVEAHYPLEVFVGEITPTP